MNYQCSFSFNYTLRPFLFGHILKSISNMISINNNVSTYNDDDYDKGDDKDDMDVNDI